MNYNKIVEKNFFEPKHVGQLASKGVNSLNCHIHKKAKGSHFDLYLASNEQGKLSIACFRAYGSPYLIAALEYVCQVLEGSSIDEHPKVTYISLVQQLELPKLFYPMAILVEKGYIDLINTMKAKLKGEDYE